MYLNIRIITEDYYFFLGIKAHLCDKGAQVSKIDFCELQRYAECDFKKNDILIFNTSKYIDEFLFIISMSTFPGRIIFIPADNKMRRNLSFRKYVSLNSRTSIDNILSEITRSNDDLPSLDIIKDELTRREKVILIHTINGMDVQTIGEQLNISIKTVYAHRRNALQKLGGRNLFEIWPVRERVLTTTRR